MKRKKVEAVKKKKAASDAAGATTERIETVMRRKLDDEMKRLESEARKKQGKV